MENLSRDQQLFNCSEEYEINYVLSLFPEGNKAEIRKFIIESCASSLIKNSTHQQVYNLIEKKFNISRGARA